MKTADGFDDAIVGIVRQFGLPDKVLYEYNHCIKILVERDLMPIEEAIEYMEFNVLGAYVGEDTPAFLVPYYQGENQDETA